MPLNSQLPPWVKAAIDHLLFQPSPPAPQQAWLEQKASQIASMLGTVSLEDLQRLILSAPRNHPMGHQVILLSAAVLAKLRVEIQREMRKPAALRSSARIATLQHKYDQMLQLLTQVLQAESDSQKSLVRNISG